MLPSKGYFSGVPCVFFIEGGCRRPHCHYRHSYQDVIDGKVNPKPQNAVYLNDRSTRTESTDQGTNPGSWSPEKISLVSKLVENAVDKALQSDPTEIPGGTSVKNTLDKVFAVSEALEFASKRKTSPRTEPAPAYNPTPISKLTKHIPVVCAEKPCSSQSILRNHAHTAPSTIATDLMHSVPSEPYQSTQVEKCTAAEAHRVLLHPVETIIQEELNYALKSNSEELDGNFQKDTHRPHSTASENSSLQCTVPLKSSSEIESNGLSKDKNSRENTAPSRKVNTTLHNDITTPRRDSTKEVGRNFLLTSLDSNPDKIDIGPVLPTSTSPVPGCPAGVVDEKVNGTHSKRHSVDCSGPAIKKRKLEAGSGPVALQVSSSADPFTRWMQNKRIREILGKDKTPTDSCAVAGQKRSYDTGTKQYTTTVEVLEDELPQPKISKRFAHKTDECRPMPILSEEVKIPSALRHHFCSAFFNELKKTLRLDDAKRKASEDELKVAKHSKTAKTYKNNCTLMILKYRKGEEETVKLKTMNLTPDSCPDFTHGWSLYKSFSRYLLSEKELRDNGFPLAVPGKPNCAYVDKSSRRHSQQPEKHGVKICANCSEEFRVEKNGFPTTRDDCVYHWGKLRRVHYKGQTVEKYTCCSGSADSVPCESSTYHVWYGGNEDCMEGFVETKKLPSYMKDHEAGIYALDCEMCYTTKGLELARLTVLDLNGDTVFDEVLSMRNPVLNYCTRFSGLDARKTASATHTFEDVRAWILEHFYDKTILVGHSLENDMKALKLIHRTVVDTSVTFPHKFGPPNKMSLKHLANVELQVDIQENVGGHDSKEDADTCLKLMMKKIQNDSKYLVPVDRQNAIGVVGFTDAFTTAGQAFAIEAVITAFLLLVVCSVTDPNRTDLANSAPVAIGLAIAACHIFAVPYTGAAMNPARAFGPAAMVGDQAWNDHWIYWVAPLIGGTAAGLLYRFVFRAPKDEDSSYDL